MAKKQKKPDGAPRKPCGFLYVTACFFVRLYFSLFYGLTIDNKAIKGIKAPVLMLANHQSNLDFMVAAIAAYPLRFHIMVTTYFFNSRILRWLLTIMGTIPKKQFMPDTAAIKSAMKVAARGGNITIFPEGQVCYSGSNCDIDESIAKLIKKLGITVINMKIRGNHLTYPKWAKGQATYKGRIECTAEVLFTPQQLQTMTTDEIAARTIDAISYDEYAWQREHMAIYKPAFRTTDGLEIVLYRCPQCEKLFAMQAREDRLICEHCGYAVRMNAYGLFEAVIDGQPMPFGDPAQWYQAQKAIIRKQIEQGEIFSLESPCNLYKTISGKHGYHPCGAGTVALTRAGLVFTGIKDGVPFTHTTLYERQTHVPHSAVYCAIDVHGDGENYAYQPLEPRHMLYIVEAYAIARRQAVNNK